MNSYPLDFDTSQDKLRQVWQEITFSQPGDPAEIARTIAHTVRQFDRKSFWRNFREYAACGVMAIVFVGSAAFGYERIVPVPLIGLAAVSFVMGYLWWKHRDLKALDPSADASGYKAALLARYDRQIRLLRGARYWYFFPLYVWILAATVVNALHRPPRLSPLAHVITVAVSLVVVTAVFIWLARLNHRYASGRLAEAKKRAESLFSEPATEE